MRKTSILICAALAQLLLFSCTDRMQEQSPDMNPEHKAYSKLIHSSENATAGKLLVYFNEEATGRIEAVTPPTKSGIMTRSGIDDFDSALESIGVKSLHRLFPVDSRNEERTRAAGLHRWYVVNFDESVDLDRAAVDLASVSEVKYVEFNRRFSLIGGADIKPASSIPVLTRTGETQFNDPNLASQWHYINTGDTRIYSRIREGADINVQDAWRLTAGDPRVIVAVVDEGVQWNHPDLADNMWANSGEIEGNGIDDDGNGFVDDVHGFNFVLNTALADSTSGSHGTHVAGTVAAVNNNGIGVCGVAGGTGSGDGARIMSCQIFSGEGGGTPDISSAAIKYAADNGASILQCSFGYPAGNPTSDEGYKNSSASVEQQAIDYFISQKNCDAVDGGIVIFAAGNEMTGMSSYPGAYADYISVTAMSCDYTPAYYTNYGPGCNIAAPGGDAYQSALETNYQSSASQVLSTVTGGQYGYSQGTSMACPHVSGIAALGLAYALELGKTFTRDEFNSILLTSVNNINQYCIGTKQYVNDAHQLATLSLSRFSGLMGSGYIDAYQVLMNIRGTTCIPVSVGSQSQINIADYIGSGGAQVSISEVSISAEDKARLGITSDPVIFGNNILLTCTKTGSGIMEVTVHAGTSSGSGMFGKATKKEFALIARASHSQNGGWL